MSEIYQIAKARTIQDNIYTHCDVLVYRKMFNDVLSNSYRDWVVVPATTQPVVEL